MSASKKRKKGASAGPGAAGDAATKLVPVALTLEPGVHYDAGLLPPPVHLASNPTAAANLVVMPPRERHTAATLAAGPAARGGPPAERGPAASSGYDILELMTHDNMWGAQTPEDALRAVASSELLADAEAIEARKQEVRRGASTAPAAQGGSPASGGSRVPRLVTASLGALTQTPTQQTFRFVEHGHVTYGEAAAAIAAAEAAASVDKKRLNATDRTRAVYEVDRDKRALRYFANDEELDAEQPFEMAPDHYAVVQRLLEEYGPRFDARRHVAQQMGAAPRRELEECTMRYLDVFRYAPERGSSWRACCNGDHGTCLFQQLAHLQKQRQFAYVAREFLTPMRLSAWNERRRRNVPVSEAPIAAGGDGPCGPCIDCLLYTWSVHVHSDAALKNVALEPINTFTVKCGKGEFDSACMLPNQIDGRMTGIQGHVPIYTTHARQYETRPAPGDTTGTRSVSYLALVGQGFWRSLSEANACVGIRKQYPLLGAAAARYVRVPVEVPAAPGGPAAASGAWQLFLDSMPTGVLADRVFFAPVGTKGSAQTGYDKVPAVSLRRMLLHQSPDLLTHWVRLHVQPVATLHGDLCALLGASTASLPRHLRDLAEAAVAPFEHSVAHWTRASRGHAFGPLAALLGPDPQWRQRMLADWALGLLLPPPLVAAFATGAVDAMATAAAASDYTLWLVAMWRCAVVLLLVHVVRPYEEEHAAEWARVARYTCDTHLDLLTLGLVACAPGAAPEAVSDTRLLAAGDQGLLARLYPQANRVCCFEELPAIAAGALLYAGNPWFDKGNKKSQENLAQAMEHDFLHKLKAEVCQRRAWPEILLEDCERYPAVRNLVVLILRAVALGNLPGARDPLPLVARLRLNAALSPHFALCAPERLDAWISDHQLVTLFMLREYFIALAEADLVFDRYFSQTLRWSKFKELVRLANGDWRREVAAQTAQRGPFVPMDWAPLERARRVPDKKKLLLLAQGKKGGGDGMTVERTGRMVGYHDKVSPMNSKLKKGCVYS